MPKNDVSSWDPIAANNTDVGGVDLNENTMRPRDVNNAIRTVMAQIATGIDGGEFGPTDAEVREKLTANRTYYVGSTIPTPTITIATPAVVSSTAHGLSLNSAVVFNVPQNTTAATITAANPAVVSMTNTFAAGRPVVFSSTGSLPIPLVEGTTYYVIATGLSGSSFQVSATAGGSAINTTAPTATFSNGSANIGITNANTYLAVGRRVRFATTGGLPTNFATGTDYYVLTASSTLITVSATNGGSAIVAGSAGTGTQTVLQAGSHFCSTGGALPTGITEGTTYYVISAGLTANAFQVSASQGGAAVNTSGSVTGSPIYNAYTGSDSSTGLAATVASAFLTIQKAINAAAGLDNAGVYVVNVSIVDGAYPETLTLKPIVGGTAATRAAITGNTTTPSNVVVRNINAASAGAWKYEGMKLVPSGATASVSVSSGSDIEQGAVDFGVTTGAHHITVTQARFNFTANYAISGGTAYAHMTTAAGTYLTAFSRTVTLTGPPAFPGAFSFATQAGVTYSGSMVYSGSAIAPRYLADSNGVIVTSGGGASYFPGNSVGATATGGQYA